MFLQNKKPGLGNVSHFQNCLNDQLIIKIVAHYVHTNVLNQHNQLCWSVLMYLMFLLWVVIVTFVNQRWLQLPMSAKRQTTHFLEPHCDRKQDRVLVEYSLNSLSLKKDKSNSASLSPSHFSHEQHRLGLLYCYVIACVYTYMCSTTWMDRSV